MAGISNAGSIGTLQVDRGSLKNVNFVLHGQAGQGLGLGTLDVHGDVLSCNFDMEQGAGSIKANAIYNSSFDTTKDIVTFEVRGKKGVTGTFFDGTNVTASNIGVVILHDVQPASTNGLYGIRVDKVVNYKRYANGKVVKALKPPTLLASPTVPETSSLKSIDREWRRSPSLLLTPSAPHSPCRGGGRFP